MSLANFGRIRKKLLKWLGIWKLLFLLCKVAQHADAVIGSTVFMLKDSEDRFKFHCLHVCSMTLTSCLTALLCVIKMSESDSIGFAFIDYFEA